jgi:hypothetical protein
MVLRAYQKHYYNYLQSESNLQFLSHVIINNTSTDYPSGAPEFTPGM